MKENTDKKLFEPLGFSWDRGAAPPPPTPQPTHLVCHGLKRMLAQYVWDAAVLEGNPFTFVQVQTVLDGVTVGGQKLSDQEQVLNLGKSTMRLIELVKSGGFALDKCTFCELHALVAREEALEWGHFRGEGEVTTYTPEVALGEAGRYVPPATDQGAVELKRIFARATKALLLMENPLERGISFFLHGALMQYFFDGNKRTSRAMMNGVLMSHGIQAISVPAAKREEFNERMVRFYLEKDATDMMAFMTGLLEGGGYKG